MKRNITKNLIISGLSTAIILAMSACGSGLPTTGSSTSPSTGGGGGGGGGGGNPGGGGSPGSVATRALGGAQNAGTRAVTVDSSGNTYTMGRFTNNTANANQILDFAGATLLGKSATSSNDVYLAKMDAAGDQVWIKTFGGTGNDQGYYAAVDSAGNVYGVLTFENSTGDANSVKDFAGNAVLGIKATTQSVAAVFKLDSNGSQQWIKFLGGTSIVSILGIGIDSANNVYVGGNINNDSADLYEFVDFAGAALLGLHSAANQDNYVAKLNSSGTQQWIRLMGGSGADSLAGLTVSAAGDVFASGKFLNDTGNTYAAKDFAGSTLLGLVVGASMDAWVAKLNTGGTQQWIHTLGGTSTIDVGAALALDGSGNVYVGGYYENDSADARTVKDFAGQPLLGKSSSGSTDGYLAKLDSAGAQQWIRVIGGTTGTQTDRVLGVATDSSGNVYAIGNYFNSSADVSAVKDFAGVALLGKTSTNSSDGYLAKLDSAGVQQSIATMGGSAADNAYGVACYSGMAIVTGDFNNSSSNANSVIGFANTTLSGRNSSAANNIFFERFTF